jgi:hypothetical protein
MSADIVELFALPARETDLSGGNINGGLMGEDIGGAGLNGELMGNDIGGGGISGGLMVGDIGGVVSYRRVISGVWFGDSGFIGGGRNGWDWVDDWYRRNNTTIPDKKASTDHESCYDGI